MKKLFNRFLQNRFLFEELVKRDFKRKYKRTVLGMVWSVLAPLMTLMVLKIVFSTFFGRTIPHYTIYLFCGTLLFSFYRESTYSGMVSLVNNASIFTKINVPKYIFLLSSNVSGLINFTLSLLVFFAFCIFDDIDFSLKTLLLIYPIFCLVIFNLGVSLILSALYLFFRDVQYLYDIFTMLLMYLSAIFYTVEMFPEMYQKLFLLNPLYVYISCFREIVVNNQLLSPALAGLAFGYAALSVLLGSLMYRKFNRVFLYYV